MEGTRSSRSIAIETSKLMDGFVYINGRVEI